jgi:hypothetical protein
MQALKEETLEILVGHRVSMIVKLSVDAIAVVAIIEPQYDSKISDPIQHSLT